MSDDLFDGGPAFPLQPASMPELHYLGMSLRDWFAGQVIASVRGWHSADKRGKSASVIAYEIADDMLAARGAIPPKVANRIEELEAENKGLRHMILDQINSAGDDPEIMAATRTEWAARAKDAEAKLAKAVEIALEECPFQYGTGSYNDWWHDRRTTLAELKGGSDEQTTDSNDY